MLENGYVCDRLDYCATTDPRHQHQAGEQTAGKKGIPDPTRKSRTLLVWCGSRLKCKRNGLLWQTEAEGLPGGGAEDGVEGSTQVVFLC